MAGDYSPVRHEVIDCKGGLDLVTPLLKLPPGVLRDSLNYEVSITGGYTRIAGYERFDGRAAPSDSVTYTLTPSTSTGITVGLVVNGQTSGATATVSYVDTSVIPNIVAYTKLTGTFVVGENLRSGVTVLAVINALGGVTTSLQQAIYVAASADIYRALIAAVPGSGPIRGIVNLNDTIYAFRDNVGSTVCNLYKSSTSGWVQVTYGKELAFTAGLVQINDGVTVTGGTSGATGVVARAVLESGVWGTTAAGRLILSSTTGTFSAGETIKVGATNCATNTGAQVQIAPLPSGTYYITRGTVSGTATALGGSQATKAYGADGVNRGFEFDGTTYVPIKTGNSPDTPRTIAPHKNYLFMSFKQSLQFSSIGAPYQWQVITGAGEIGGLPEDVVDIVELPGNQQTGALVIMCQNNVFILYGTSSTTWNLVPYNTGTGAYFRTTATMSDTYFGDVRGVSSLKASLNYGNFDSAQLTLNLRPFFQNRRTLAVDSSINREKSQYRIFFSDGYGLYVTINNGEYLGSMPVLFPNAVACVTEGLNSTGVEKAYFGSTNGMVYQLDAGTSFDGAALSSNLTFTFNAKGDARQLKRWRKASVEIQGTSYAGFQFTYDLAYASSVHETQPLQNYVSSLSSVYWDSFTWDNFVWDGTTLQPTELEVQGSAENIALRFSSSNTYVGPYTINSITMHYSPRRGLR
jgi:hypothetical protein